jgi:hypothetical protein
VGRILGGQLASQFWLKGKNVGKYSPKCWTISLPSPPLLLQIDNFNFTKLNKRILCLRIADMESGGSI